MRTVLSMLIVVLLALLPGSATAELPGVRTILDLDRESVLHFAIMSDHKGESPLSSVEFARLAAWVKQGEAAFVVGLGDHVKINWENSFIPWIQGDRWWRQHAYLNVADGENEYFSPTHRQSDYGGGAPLLDLVNLEAHATIERPNPSEYYARINVGDYAVHLIQMHYSDQPADSILAFPEQSRAWLMQTLEGIDKGEEDLILVGAHSRHGSWDLVLSPERRNALLSKADLVLSATTHNFRAWVPDGFSGTPAVCVNTGAVNFPGYMTPNGYVEIHVLSDGAIVGQYIDLTQTSRQLQRGRFAWIKPRDGTMRQVDLRPEQVLAVLADSVGVAELQPALSSLLQELTGADLAQVRVRNGLPAGPVTLEDAWRVFDKNRNLRVVRVPEDRVDAVAERLELDPVNIDGAYARVAVDQPATAGLIASAGITYETLEPQAIDQPGLREVDLVREWLRRR
ncbi:MAG TPA: hypothetical protein QGF95_20480 [Candidatus Latescibacteria bacterium]|jgi:hypothetical protein|nr:hypothetical protein [Gemmatimonadaceae bacterium]MDP6016728.1 hypothetical protein [Candidatus Latescibacterota bacterium]HJP32932.1 hypothetical protein [Candidatus Latescibacterota bacterium]